MSIFNLFNKKSEKTTNVAPQETNAQIETQSEPVKEEKKAEVPKEEIPKGTRRVHNLIILDESGSMQSIYRPALTGVNETLQTIRSAQEEHQDQQHFVTLVAFDTNHYNQIYAHVSAAEAKDITEEQYRPCGGTPLYDAMGRGLTELRPNVGKEDIVLVTVITDGYENASQEYNGKAIKSLVEAMKNEGWVFTYIGANQDVEAVAASLSIDNHLAFNADDDGTNAMFAKECSSRKRFFSKIHPDSSIANIASDYFNE